MSVCFCVVAAPVFMDFAFSALMLLVGQQEVYLACKNWLVGCWRGYLSGWGGDLHMAQMMPLPFTISCSSKSRLVLPFWYWLTRVVPDKRPLNGCISSSFTDFVDVTVRFEFIFIMVSHVIIFSGLHLEKFIGDLMVLIILTELRAYPAILLTANLVRLAIFSSVLAKRLFEKSSPEMTYFVFNGMWKLNSVTQGSYRPWKVLELKCWDFQAWKTLEKSWNSKVVVLELLISGTSIANLRGNSL